MTDKKFLKYQLPPAIIIIITIINITLLKIARSVIRLNILPILFIEYIFDSVASIYLTRLCIHVWIMSQAWDGQQLIILLLSLSLSLCLSLSS